MSDSEGIKVCSECREEIVDHQTYTCEGCKSDFCQTCLHKGWDEEIQEKLEEQYGNEETLCGHCLKQTWEMKSKNGPQFKQCKRCGEMKYAHKIFSLGGKKGNMCEICILKK